MCHATYLRRLGAFSLASLPLLTLADNARDWQNVPINLNMVFGYYNDINTNTTINTSLPIDGLSLNADLYLLRYAYSFDLAGRNSAIQIIQPYADVDASFDHARFFTGTRKNGGMGDTQIIFAHNFFGGPALTQEAFSSWQPGTFFSGAITLTVPNGDYDQDRVINIGANRWVVKPELAFGHPIGPTWLEVNTWLSLYGDNDDYLRDRKLEQRPIFAIEGHYSYTLNRALWVSLDATWSKGGETKIEGVNQHNEQENTLLGASLGFMLSPQFGGLVAYSDTVSKQSGSADVETWTFRLQYVW
ncbi:transporter [Azomonas macrocytogenes]|uniref:Transporter n=1 Tax=Azomonas macrocytogenes TaxID=69962 RepID=A0A839T9G3_AZOMA|nr:transporter [Azomonas macrocytogenes]MBB3105106.1 hypothetical protein [Azomonas macrocytogenes]